MTKMVTYTKDQKKTVEAGIDAIREVLKGDDSQAKRSLLLCLDWYMDPFYGHRHEIMPFHEELKELLQEVILEDPDGDVKEDHDYHNRLRRDRRGCRARRDIRAVVVQIECRGTAGAVRGRGPFGQPQGHDVRAS